MRSAERGMTLIEVMMALSVIVVAIMGVLGLIPATMKLINDSNEHEIARCAAETEIAKIRAAGVAVDGTTTFPVGGLTPIAVGADCGEVIVSGGPDGTKELVVSVSWRGMDKIDKGIEIRTLVGQ